MRVRNAPRALATGFAVLLLSGCALPPVVTVASFALDFASYGETGKSVTDHGISFVLQEDCALLRVFEGEICRAKAGEAPETALVALEPMSDPRTGVATTQADSMVLPGDLAYLDDAEGALFAGPVGAAAFALMLRSGFAAETEAGAAGSAAPVAFDGIGYLRDG